MYSRRGFLIGLTLVPLIGLLIRIPGQKMLNHIYGTTSPKKKRQSIKQCWVLQEGDI